LPPNRYGYAVSMFYIYGKDLALFYGWEVLKQYHFYMSFCFYIGFFVGFVVQIAITAGREGGSVKKVQLFKYQFTHLAWTVLMIFLCVFQLTFVTQHILEGVFWFFLPVTLSFT
jgi:hypothetical protein